MKRKLKQLSDRRSKKEARTSVYSTLEANKLTEEQYGLMSSSSKLGHTLTKKERLKRYLDLERAGIKLTEDQRSELYVEREDISEEEKEEEGKAIDSDMLKKAEEMMSQENGPSFRVSKKKRKAMRKEKVRVCEERNDELRRRQSSSVLASARSVASLPLTPLLATLVAAKGDDLSALQGSIDDCDVTLSSMQEMLLGFQADLGGISEEIKSLQEESMSMNVKLRNR